MASFCKVRILVIGVISIYTTFPLLFLSLFIDSFLNCSEERHSIILRGMNFP